MKNQKLFYVLFLAMILALSCIFVSAEEVETPEGELPEDELVGIGPYVYAVSIHEANVSLKRGQGVQLSFTNGYPQGTITWTSNSSCVVVTSDGYIRGVSAGTATITAWNNSAPSQYIKYDTCTVTVSSTQIIESDAYALVSSFDVPDTWFPFEGSRTPSDNASVNVGPSLGRTGYTWWITLGSDGLYTIRSMYSLKYLKCYNNSITAGTPIARASASNTAGCKWSVMEVESGVYAFIPSSATNANVRLGVEMTEDETYMLLLNFSSSNHEDTEWNLIRMLPTCGDEITFDNSEWNNQATSYQYAINLRWLVDSTGWTVGNVIEGSRGGCTLANDDTDIENIIDAVQNDFYAIENITGIEHSFYEIAPYEYCNEGDYKIALLVGENGRLWLRQDSNGFWSYLTLENNGAPQYLDENLDAIIDPQCAYFSGYDTFVAYFAVTPWN